MTEFVDVGGCEWSQEGHKHFGCEVIVVLFNGVTTRFSVLVNTVTQTTDTESL